MVYSHQEIILTLDMVYNSLTISTSYIMLTLRFNILTFFLILRFIDHIHLNYLFIIQLHL